MIRQVCKSFIYDVFYFVIVCLFSVVFILLAQLEQVEYLPESWHVVLHDREEELLAHEDDGQLYAELHEAAARTALLLAIAEVAVVVVGGADVLALEEGNVEDGGVIVHELEEVDLQGEGVIKGRLSSMELLLSEPEGKLLVDVVEDEDEHQVDAGASDGDEQAPVTPDGVVIDSGKSNHHGHPVEDDGEDSDEGQQYEHEDRGPRDQDARQLHAPEGRLGLRSPG